LDQGAVIPLAVGLKVQNGEFNWEFDPLAALAGECPSSPVGFHPSHIAGTPLFEDDRFIIKFNNFSRGGKPRGERRSGKQTWRKTG